MAYHSVFRPDTFAKKVALVTGGGTGLGRCIAHELASLGAIVIIAARRSEPLEQTSAEIEAIGEKIFHYTLNIRDVDSAQSVIKRIIVEHGRLDFLVNNAGGQFLSPAANMSTRGFQTVLELNVLGTWNMCKAAFDNWMRDHGGTIVNIVVDFRNGFPLMVHTGAARAAVDNMSVRWKVTKTLCQEWGRFGIRVNAVAPGLIISNGFKNYPPPVQELLAGEYHSQNPSGRLGTESEISSAVVWLLSPGAAYVNGTTLSVDGGSSLSKGNMIPFATESKLSAYVAFPTTNLRNRDIPEPFQKLLDLYTIPTIQGKL